MRFHTCLAWIPGFCVALDAASGQVWTATFLNPSGQPFASAVSCANGASGTQGGQVFNRAALWQSTPESFVSLHPEPHVPLLVANRSQVHAVDDSYQVGEYTLRSEVPGIADQTFALLWQGSASSCVVLHPPLSNIVHSYAYGIGGGQQVGEYTLSGSSSQRRAVMWTGTASSFVTLHPAGVHSSTATCTDGVRQGGFVVPLADGYAHAALWSGSPASYINLNPPGVLTSEVRALAGTMQVGWYWTGTGYRACVWTGSASSMMPLPPSDAANSRAWGAIVVAGDTYIVGDVDGEAALWTNAGQTYINLQQAAPETAGAAGSAALSISADAQTLVVVGTAGIVSNGAVLWHRPLPGLASCNDIDFNNDASFFDPQDIDAFLSVYAEGPCIPDTTSCDAMDFNNDTSIFDPCDIASFLLMYAEGPCTACGQ